MKYLGLAMLLAMGTIAGCDKTNAPQAAVAAAPVDEAAFLSGFDGVWATTSSAGTDDAETVFRLRFTKDNSDFVMDAHVFDVHLVDVDTDNQVVTFETSGERDPKEMLTVTRIVAAADRGKPDAPFTLRITFGNGQFSDLSFVRRLSAQDMTAIAEARTSNDEADVGSVAAAEESTDDCANATNFVDRTTCKEGPLKLARREFEMAFSDAQTNYGVDAQNSLASAQKQLDACTNTECLQKAYSDWTRYVGENYPDNSPHAE